MNIRSRALFWETACFVGPVVAAVTPPVVVALLGGFDGFHFIGQQVSPAQTMGILGAMLFPFVAYQLLRLKAEEALACVARSWRTARGTVQSVELQARWIWSAGRMYSLRIRYAYEVDGIAYQGDRLAFAPRLLHDWEAVNALYRKYPVQAVVSVHYDPTVPEDAVLETTGAFARHRLRLIWLPLLAPFVVAALIALRV